MDANSSTPEKVSGPVGDRCLSVVMPAFNEEATIGQVIEKVLALPELAELVIIDDCSTDATHEIVQRLAERHPLITLITNDENLGKTGSIRRGFALTKGSVVIVQDADLEYDPVEISKLVAPIVAGKADVVYGVRFSKEEAADLVYYSHYLANRAITLLSNILAGQNLSDIQTCYIAFRGSTLRSMVITSKRFGFEVEAAAKLAKLKIPILEIPISYKARTREAGKKLTWPDGFAAVWYICKYNLFTGLKRSFRLEPSSSPEAADSY